MRVFYARALQILAVIFVCLPTQAFADGHAVAGDFDGNGVTDIAITRTVTGGLNWFVRHDTGFVGQLQFGLVNDTPISGDYNGDGNYEPAVIRKTGNFADWLILDEQSGNAVQVAWGFATDSFLNGYLDADNAADLVAVRAVNGTLTWFIRGSAGEQFTEVWGFDGNTPFLADLTGDGVDELLAVGKEGGFLRWYPRTRAGAVPLPAPFFGLDTDVPSAPIDFDGNGIADFAVTRKIGAFNVFFVRLNNADLSVKEERQIFLGLSNDQPFAGNFFAGAEAKVAVFRNTLAFATFFFDLTGDPASALSVNFGLKDDALVIPRIAASQKTSNSGICQNVVSISDLPGVLYKPINEHGGRGPTLIVKIKSERTGTKIRQIRDANCNLIGTVGLASAEGPYGERYYSRSGGTNYSHTQLRDLALATGGSTAILFEGVNNKWIRVENPVNRQGRL